MKQSPLNGKNILVVDDEVELRNALVFDLARRGCNVFEAPSGKEAIKIVKSNQLDIVVSDVRMPNGDGVELLKEIRELNLPLPIVFLSTGYADLQEDQAKKLGAHALMTKPVDRKKMLALLESSCLSLPKNN